ncbi:MAG: ImmA/IrrE family metallo-endopeptidase [Romboutsia sp.]
MISSTIKREVKDLINEYKTNNPYDLVKCLGISHVRFPLSGRMNGYYTREFDGDNICTNSNLSKEEEVVVLAHEIGHAILHPGQCYLFRSTNTYYSKSKFERDANIFAAELLLDDNIFEEYVGYSLYDISKIVGMSVKLLEYKYKNLENKLDG